MGTVNQKVRARLALAAWLERNSVSNAEFARRIHRHRSFVSHLLAGRVDVSIDLAFQIEQLTSGGKGRPVYARDWAQIGKTVAA